MQSRTACFAFLASLVVLTIVFLVSLQACSPAQQQSLDGAAKNMQSARDALVGSPTTAPSPLVTTVEAIAPEATPWIQTAGMVLGIGASVLMGMSNLSKNNAIREVVSDVKAWNQPNVPFSAKTEKIVASVSGILAAAPMAVSPIEIAGLNPSANPQPVLKAT